VNHNGRWATPETFAAEKAERIAQRKANAEWLPVLAKWKGWLRDADHRAEAERNLASVDDPRAFPSVVKTFATPRPDDQAMAVQVLGQIDSMPASRALAVIAVLGSTGEIRRAATETLRGRDVRSYAGDLIGLIREKVAYEFKPVNGPGQPGALLVKGDRVNHGRIYAPPPLPDFQLFPGEPIYYDDFGLPVVQRTTGLVTTQRSGGTAYVTGQQYINGSAPQLSAADQKAFATFRNNPAYAPSVMEGHLWKAGSVPAIYPMQGSDFDVRLDRTITESRLTEAFIPIGRMIAETRMSAMVMQQQLKNDVMEIENLNQRIADDNTRVVSVLNAVSGQDFGPDRDTWKSWWSDQLGYSYVPPRPYPRPTLVEMVPPAYVPQPVQPVERLGPLASAKTDYSIRSELTQSGTDRYAAMGVYRCCFGAGTPVMTLTGPKPIEELRVGDRVLARNQETGGLSYRPVLTVFHYPPTETLRLQVQGDSLVTSPLHRFWRVGDGWIMARDLKPGDAIRTLRGQVPVQGVEPDTKQPVFNLNVAEDSSFLVGNQGVLVHDNTLPDLLAKPFDVPAALARAGGAE
jgi:hypothetical protein